MKKTGRPSGIKSALKIIVALGIFAMVFLAAVLPGPGLTLRDIERVLVRDTEGKTHTLTRSDEILLLCEGWQTGKTEKGEVLRAALSSWKLDMIKKNQEVLSWTLWINPDLNGKEMWIKSGETLKQLDPWYFDRLMALPAFETLYPRKEPPAMGLMMAGSVTPLVPDQSQWYLRKTDGAFYPMAPQATGQSMSNTFKMTADTVLGFQTEEEPDAFNLEISRDGVRFLSTDVHQNIPLHLEEDGLYQCSVHMTWDRKESRSYYGEAAYSFVLEADYPPQFEVSSGALDPGELLVIKATHVNEDQPIEISTGIDFKPGLFKQDDAWIILLPVSFYHEGGKTYELTLSCGGTQHNYEVKVKDKEFIIQYLTIDPGVAAATRNEKSAKEMQEKVYPLKSVSDDKKYWNGLFMQPVEGGRVTPADFGKRRYVNKAPTSYRHNGLDIGQDEGAPVMASNSGRVLLAEYLIETGNTVIIEHGFGLKTWYYHMSELKCKTGDMVKKGDVIGLVGSTGFSTGPHLHFSASVNNVWINPMTLISEGVPFFQDTED